MHEGANAHERLKITIPGQRDLTRWKRIRQIYGGSKVEMQQGQDSFTGLLEDWVLDNTKTCIAFIRVHQRSIIDKEAIKEIQTTEEALTHASEEDLAFYWRVRYLQNLNKNVK